MSEELTVREAGEYLDYSYSTMNCARQTGRLGGGEAPKFFKRRGLILYKKSSLDEWLENQDSAEAIKTTVVTKSLWIKNAHSKLGHNDSNDIAIA
ncbi:MAG: helix-turn-helix domain-containing protein [Gammaproteobacteria bacterium]